LRRNRCPQRYSIYMGTGAAPRRWLAADLNMRRTDAGSYPREAFNSRGSADAVLAFIVVGCRRPG